MVGDEVKSGDEDEGGEEVEEFVELEELDINFGGVFGEVLLGQNPE